MDSHLGATAHNTINVLDNDAGTSANAVDLSNDSTVTRSDQGEMDAVLRVSRQEFELDQQRMRKQEEDDIARAKQLSLQESRNGIPGGSISLTGEGEDGEGAAEAAVQESEPQFQAEEIKRAQLLSLHE